MSLFIEVEPIRRDLFSVYETSLKFNAAVKMQITNAFMYKTKVLSFSPSVLLTKSRLGVYNFIV